METQLKHSKAAPEHEQGASGRRRFWRGALLAGALAGCAGGFTAVSYQTARLPDNGDGCPSVGPSFQVFRGQEIGFGTGRRPLYVARVTNMEGSDVTLDLRTPLALPASRGSAVAYVVTIGGIRTDTDGLGRLANSACRLMNGPSSQADGGVAGAPAVNDGGAAGSDGGAGGAVPVSVTASRPQELDGTPFPRDVSAEFSRMISERLGSAVSAAFGLVSGNAQGGQERAELAIDRSDDSSFTLSVRNAQSVKLYRRVEVQWDVSVPQEATLRMPYRITSMRIEGGRVTASVALDCSRDMEAVGRGLDVRSGPHPMCADPALDIQPSQKK